MSASTTMCLSEVVWTIVLVAHVRYTYVTGAEVQREPWPPHA